MEMQGRHAEGWQWMSAARPHWAEGNGFACHLGWHQAFVSRRSTATRGARGLRRPPRTGSDRDHAAAARRRVAALAPSPGRHRRRRALACLRRRLDARCERGGLSTFNDLHAVLALVGAGELGRADAYVRAAEAAAERGTGSNRAVMRSVGALAAARPARVRCRPLRRGDASARPSPRRRDLGIGGSHAQRDVIE